MEDRYPYIGEKIQVTQDMCDLNGHMNVVFYVHIFEHGSLNFYHDLGFSSEYFSEGFSNFTLEMNVKYIKEMKEGEIALPRYRVFDVKPKLIHCGGVIFNESGDVCATQENVLVHVDMGTRKSCEMNEKMVNRIQQLVDESNNAGPPAFDLRLSIR